MAMLLHADQKIGALLATCNVHWLPNRLLCSDYKAANVTDSPDLKASVGAFRTPELRHTVTLAYVA
jgi:hypothetical protein